MTLNEYAIKLGLHLNAPQIQILDLIEKSKDESLIITFPRLSGRQLLYNLIERKKGYDEGYLQGQADAIDECIAQLKNKWTDSYQPFFDAVKGLEQLKEKQNKEIKICSTGEPCIHPNCKKCGTTHFISECTYGKEKQNG